MRLSVRTDSFLVTGQLNHLPVREDFDIKIMEYGDLSSLVTEYPDYNSMGQVLTKINTVSVREVNNEAVAVNQKVNLPSSVSSFGDLAGRALILTSKDGDLVAYGILVNELKEKKEDST